jgi:hypothetical protein
MLSFVTVNFAATTLVTAAAEAWKVRMGVMAAEVETQAVLV